MIGPRIAVALAAAGALSTPAFAQDAPRYAAAGDIQGGMKPQPDGAGTFALPTGAGTTVLAARRDRPGDVEVHKALNDEFLVQSGHAVVLVGGQVAGQHETAPGEWRGGQMTGGQRYSLGPGDALWIPAGQPHQVTPAAGETFVYFAVKFPVTP